MDWDRNLDPPEHDEKMRPKVRLATITLLVDDSQLEDSPACTNPKGLAHWLDKYIDVYAFEIDRATKEEK